MSSLTALFERREMILTEGSVFELLRRHPDVRFDSQIAHAALIYDASSRALLAEVHRSYIDVARRSGLPILAFADTWRASGERIAASPFRDRNVNRDNVEFLRGIASGERVFVGALIGPGGDAYRPEEALSTAEAMRYHAFQIDQLAADGVDLIEAATLPAFSEARGMATLLSQTGIPWMLSFVVRPSAVLLDGTPLEEAIRTIDDSLSDPPVGYAINCVHPDIARQALAALAPDVRSRVIAFQGNTSARTPEELDNLPHVDSADPRAFAAAVSSLLAESSVCVVGGCCGTDESHMSAVAGVVGARARGRRRDEACR